MNVLLPLLKRLPKPLRNLLKRARGLNASLAQKTSMKRVYSGIFSEIDANPCVKIHVETKDFFQKEIDADGNFNRYDTLVRYLAVENFYGKNDFGFEMYLKMQKLRLGKHFPQLDYLESFKSLIRRFENVGYDDDYPLLVSNELKLLDGSHRFALVLYHETPNICISPVKSLKNITINYGIDWFREKGFSAQEIAVLQSTFDRLEAKHTSTFAGILWSPAHPFKDEILSDIDDTYRITESRELAFDNRLLYENFVRGIYHIDEIADWKIAKKIKYMEDYPPQVTIFEFKTSNPQYRKKSSNRQCISIGGETLKKQIRHKYSKRLDRYFHDILLHIGDNEVHSNYMRRLASPKLSIVEFLDNIRGEEYVVLKTDTPYLPTDFPRSIPFGKDLDILCAKTAFSAMKRFLLEFTQQYEGSLEPRIISGLGEIRVRFELSGFLIYQIDIRTEMHGADTEALIRCRLPHLNFFVPALVDEAWIRANEYLADTSKTHHLDYVTKALPKIDETSRIAIERVLVGDSGKSTKSPGMRPES